MPEGGTTTPIGADPFFVDPGVGSPNAWDEATRTSRTELLGHLRTKGWDKLSPIEAAGQAMKSYGEVERMLGVPKDQLVRFPKDQADVDGWKALNQRMGVPEKADGYAQALASIKFENGDELEDAFIAPMRDAFLAAGLRPDQATKVLGAVVKFMDGNDKTEATNMAAKLQEQVENLNKEWGQNAESNRFIATQAALKMGATKEQIDAAQNMFGYDLVWKMLYQAGKGMGEARYIADGDTRNGKVMTAPEAQVRLDELKRDSNWVARVNSGDFEANQELNNLHKLIAMGPR